MEAVEIRALIALILFSTVAYAQLPPYPKSPVIKGVEFNWSSHLRLATGSDNWPVTWADDNHQYVVWGDGGGFGGTNGIGRSSIGVARVENNWHDFKPFNIWGGHETQNSHEVIGKSYGIVCIGRVLYMWVGMFETKTDPFKEVKIALSEDHGATWHFTDWSFKRDDGVMMPTLCNYGKNYEGARDEFVYSYLIRFQSYDGPDDYPDKVDWLNCQKPGLIDLARVPKDKILDREAYTFFAGMKDGEPTWTKDMQRRKAVFENPAGVGWCINVSFNAGLKRYILTTEHTETHRGNIGIFDAPNPWGPWTTACYEEKWGEGHVPLNTFFWNFSNKWMSPDGKSFSLIFTGRKENDSFNLIRGTFITE
ncbi:MAG: DUF4185 domain-containing protein [Cyclobacteriaceae bacterium]